MHGLCELRRHVSGCGGARVQNEENAGRRGGTGVSVDAERVLARGNEAVAYGAVDAGCRCYFGYPITPQNEISELLSSLLPETGGAFVQAESEVASVNMVLGAGACGVPAMTSSSGPGISLMQEGLSYMAGSMVPGVVVNMQRGGPGLGSLGPSQGDYFQAVKGGGHGDCRCLVLAPSGCQECYDMMFDAFRLAFAYRNPVMLLGDAMIAQMKEPLARRIPPGAPGLDALRESAASWRVEGCAGRAKRLIKSVYLGDGELAERNVLLTAKYRDMRAEVEFRRVETEDAELVIVAFGSVGRIARGAVRRMRGQGRRVGLLRPLTLFPFPDEELARLADGGARFLVIEQNCGQMVEDVRLAVCGRARVAWHGIMPGGFADEEECVDAALRALEE
jgi:2-oxoglutarate ferredoxin oxidoreductase subunit alpha